jgi:ATP-dependent DNA ligase
MGSPNPTEHILKFKFLDEIDCFVIQTKPGRATGSVMLGIVRETDGGILHIGNVRSGLTDAGIMSLTEAIQQGERPVLRVQYLGARTVGITLVEPKTSIAMRRNDKTWAECTTEQYAEGKREIISAATVWVA